MVSMDDKSADRIGFDSSLDEIVDATIRVTTRTHSFRAQRARAVWVAGGCLSVGILAMVFYRSRQEHFELPVAAWAIVSAVALILGPCFGWLMGSTSTGPCVANTGALLPSSWAEPAMCAVNRRLCLPSSLLL